MEKAPDLPRLPLLGIAFAQGICLYLLYRSVELKVWPSDSPLWSYPLWTLAVAVPLLLLLSVDRRNWVAAAKLVAAFGAVLALLAVYTGWQATPHGAFPTSDLTFVFVVTIGLALFKGLMYLQQRADERPLSYQVLFTNSWRNFLVGALAALFTLIFWLILMLWGQLFRVIEVNFFHDLFTEDWFVIPVLTVAFAIGIVLFRGLTRVIDSITKLLHWLIKLLLPLVLLVAIVFLAALPFTGLDLLWATGSGTGLLLWLLALVLFFTNAVYQDGRETAPYPPALHRALYVGLCVMPLIAGLAFYGLVLRVQQYGWTVERCWAFVAWTVLALFAVGYVVGIVRRRDAWTGDLARVNTAMGLVVLTVMLLANSPVLDFRKISLTSQLERLESGEVEPAAFDFWYVQRYLARPGYLAMEAMKSELGDDDAELLSLIENPLPRRGAMPLVDPDALRERMVFRPEPFAIPPELEPLLMGTALRIHATGRSVPLVPVAIRVDMDEDGADEYLLLVLDGGNIRFSQFFYRTDAGWQSRHLNHNHHLRRDDLLELLSNEDIVLTSNRYKNVSIGDLELRPLNFD
ncbi:MAG: DUF4153 domain-containing protein [Pseudomonadota bacterium]